MPCKLEERTSKAASKDERSDSVGEYRASADAVAEVAANEMVPAEEERRVGHVVAAVASDSEGESVTFRYMTRCDCEAGRIAAAAEREVVVVGDAAAVDVAAAAKVHAVDAEAAAAVEDWPEQTAVQRNAVAAIGTTAAELNWSDTAAAAAATDAADAMNAATAAAAATARSASDSA